ncbi:hypothetical protein A0J61_01350, partial [Choanephora cucurbitarum]
FCLTWKGFDKKIQVTVNHMKMILTNSSSFQKALYDMPIHLLYAVDLWKEPYYSYGTLNLLWQPSIQGSERTTNQMTAARNK